ncbi:MAG: nitrate transporter substrate-binding protein [Modestobacter sp.]|nr:nitrate transporter substrate-binding protein [Modestobacter sp.]
MRRIGRRPFVALVAIVTAGALAACGSSSTEQAAAPGQVTPVSATVLAASTLAPVYAGIKNGVFSDAGIELTLTQVAPAAVVPAVVSGDSTFGFLAIPSILLAASKGLPIRIVANAGASPDSPVVVPNASTVQKYSDLAGKRIAVPNLGGLGAFAVVGALLNNGVDPKSVQLLEVPFGDMESALDRGDVDAAWLIQPFAALAEQHGKTRSLGSSVEAADMTKLGSAYFFTLDKTVSTNPDMVGRFVEAVKQSNAYGLEHVQEMVDIVPTFAQVPPEVLGPKLVSATYGDIPVDELKRVNEFMVANGFLTKSVDIDALVWDAGSAGGK